MKEKPMVPMLDRYHRPVRVGQTVEIQHCVGPYGQVRKVKGTVLETNRYGGICVELAPDTKPFGEHTRFGYDRYGPGSKYYVADAFGYDSKTKSRVGYNKHTDFEHSHETWCIVLKEVEESDETKPAAQPAHS